MARILIVSALILSLGACSSGPTIRSDFDRSTDFSAFETYGWVDEFGLKKAGYSDLVVGHFKDAVGSELDALGLQYSETNPDLLVNFAANVREVVDVRSRPSTTMSMGVGYPGYYGYRAGFYGTYPMYQNNEVDTVRYEEGTANVDLIDARRMQLVWEGVAEGRLTEEAMQNPREAIRRVVGMMFERYPRTGE